MAKVVVQCVFSKYLDFENSFNIEDPESVCVSPASDSSETIEVIIIKLGMVTSSDMVMHHVLIILILTCIQGHSY